MTQTQQTGQSLGEALPDHLHEQAHFHATGEEFLDCLAAHSHEPDAVPRDIAQRELEAVKNQLR